MAKENTIKTETLCWDNIEWLRAYIQYIQENDSEMDSRAVLHADNLIAEKPWKIWRNANYQ